MPKQSWKYHKIMSVYKRDEKTKDFLIGQWSTPEIEYLRNNIWEFTEKIDGTNIRIKYDGENVVYAGRSDDAQIPTTLIRKLDELLRYDGQEKLKSVFPEASKENEVILYGEGFGAKIQKGGGNYIKDGVNFILFDVVIPPFQLERKNVDDIAAKLGLLSVPVIGRGTFNDAIEITKKGFNSIFGDFIAEGLVARPLTEMFTRKGDRIITKVKYRDFNKK